LSKKKQGFNNHPLRIKKNLNLLPKKLSKAILKINNSRILKNQLKNLNNPSLNKSHNHLLKNLKISNNQLKNLNKPSLNKNHNHLLKSQNNKHLKRNHSRLLKSLNNPNLKGK
jgi:hypothetical protein